MMLVHTSVAQYEAVSALVEMIVAVSVLVETAQNHVSLDQTSAPEIPAKRFVLETVQSCQPAVVAVVAYFILIVANIVAYIHML